MKVIIYWISNNAEYIRRIRKKFGIKDYMSINGETPCEIRDKDMEMLIECERRGFLKIRKKKNG